MRRQKVRSMTCACPISAWDRRGCLRLRCRIIGDDRLTCRKVHSQARNASAIVGGIRHFSAPASGQSTKAAPTGASPRCPGPRISRRWPSLHKSNWPHCELRGPSAAADRRDCPVCCDPPFPPAADRWCLEQVESRIQHQRSQAGRRPPPLLRRTPAPRRPCAPSGQTGCTAVLDGP